MSEQRRFPMPTVGTRPVFRNPSGVANLPGLANLPGIGKMPVVAKVIPQAQPRQSLWRAKILVPFVLTLAGFAGTVLAIVKTGIYHGQWGHVPATRFHFFLGCTGLALAITFLPRRRVRRATLLIAALAVMLLAGMASTLVVAFFLLSCYCLGDWMLRRGSIRPEVLTSDLLSIALGAGVWSLLVGVAVHFPINTPLAYTAALSVPVIFNFHSAKRLAASLLDWSQATADETRTTFVLRSALLGLFSLHLFYASLPDISWDTLQMHLMIPTFIESHGAWSFDAANFVFAVMPMGADWLFTISNMLGGETAAKLTNLAIFAVLAGTLFGEIRRLANTRIAYLCLLLFVASPIALVETSTLFVENMLALYILAAFVVVTQREPLTTRQMIAFALFCAVGLTVKAFMLFAMPALGLVFLKKAARGRTWSDWLLAVQGVVALIALVGLYPYVYAYWKTGSPIFPYYNTFFRSEYFRTDVNFCDVRWIGHFTWDLLYQLTIKTQNFVEGPDGSLGFQYLIFLAPALWFALFRRGHTQLLALGCALVFMGTQSLTCQYLRYLYPAFPLLVLAISGAFLAAEGSRLTGWATGAMGLACIALNFYFIGQTCYYLHHFPLEAVVSSGARRDVVNESVPERHMVSYVNQIAGSEARVVMLGAPLGAGLKGYPLYVDWHNSRLTADIQAATSSEELMARLGKHGATHVLIKYPDSERRRDSLLNGVNLLEGLSKQAVLRAQLQNVDLYEIHPQAAPTILR